MQLTFADDDTSIVVGDGKKTLIVTVSDPNRACPRKTIQPYVPVTNPVQKSIVALFSPIGALRLLDLKNPSVWEESGYQFLDLCDQ